MSDCAAPAVTEITVLARGRSAALVEARPLTGRQHQIRIHLGSIRHPVVGDRRYGSTINTPRILLHAWRIEHPFLGTIEAPIPPEFV